MLNIAYKKIVLNSKTISYLRKQNKNWSKIIPIGRQTATLSMMNLPKEEELGELLSCLPTSKHLHFEFNFIFQAFSEMVQKQQDNNIVQQQQQIETISGPESIYTTAGYVHLCYRFRNSLAELKLAELEGAYTVSGETIGYRRFIDGFANLVHLDISNHTVADLSLRDVLSSCQNLSHLTCLSTLPLQQAPAIQHISIHSTSHFLQYKI